MKIKSCTLKILATLFALFFALAFVAGFVACDDGEEGDEGKTNSSPLSSISLDTSGAKLEYLIGEEFSSAGLVVTARYEDKSTRSVTGFEVDSSTYNAEVAGTYTISVKYTENGITASAAYDVIVDIQYELIYTLTSDGKGYEVSGIDGTYSGVIIPSEYNGLPVTSIETRAFENSSLTSISIPASVTSIGTYAFYNCGSLSGVSVPDAVTSIGNYAFYGCYSMKRVSIGAGVERIGDYAFYDCEAMSELDFDSVESLTMIGERAFCNCSSLTSVAIPNTVTSMGSACFSGCSGMESIAIPFVGADEIATVASASTLFGYIFGSSNYLGGTAVEQYYSSSDSAIYYIPSSLKDVAVLEGQILYGAFSNCESLQNVTISDSVTSMGSSVFSGCSGLESISLPFVGGSATATYSSASTLFGYIFGTSKYSGATAVKQCYDSLSSSNATYYIPDTLHEVSIAGGPLRYGAFYDCESLTSIMLGEDVTNIGDYAFYDCISLSSTIIPDSVEGVGSYAFYGCDFLTSAIIGNGAGKIGSYAFYKCSALSEVTIGCSVASIGDYAFYGCVSLTSVFFEDECVCESIGSYVFYNCIDLTSINIPDGVRSIGDGAFEYCSALPDMTIPDGVETIGDDAFAYCISLTDIIIPSSVSSIGGETFMNCSSLETIYIPSSVTSIGADAFYACDDLIIFVEAASQPDGWDLNWNSSDCFVTWGISEIPTEGVIYSFDSNGGSPVESVASSWLTVLPIPTREGYVFTGWYTSPDCTSESAVGVPYYSATNITLYAGWTEGYQTEGLEVVNSVVTGIGECTDTTLYISMPVADRAFYGNNQIAEVYLIYGSAYVGDESFYGCENLAAVIIGDDVTSIGNNAFAYCSSLTEITIPESVTYIGSYAFQYCTGLAAINYKANVSSDVNRVFSKAGTQTDTVLTIGANVGTITSYMFYNCNMTHVVFEEGSQCKSINEYAFCNCQYLLDITIPDSVESIYTRAFNNCISMTSLTIGTGVTCLSAYVFSNCISLTEIYLNSTDLNGSFYGSDNSFAFSSAGTGENTVVTIGANVKCIPSYLFCYSWVTSVVFNEGSQCTSIGSYAFAYCNYLLSVIIPENLTSIETHAFYSCQALMEIYYNATNMRSLSSGNYIFYNAGKNGDGITLTIGANVTNIPGYLFSPVSSTSNAPKITTVIFETDSKCTGIGAYAFLSCASITTVYYSGTAEELGKFSIGIGNSYFTSAAIYYYSEEEPDFMDEYDYWHYVDGEIVVWTKQD